MPVLTPILFAIHVHRRLALWVVGFCLLVGGALSVFADDDKAGSLGILLFFYGVVKLLWNFRSPEKHKAYLLLSKTPERVVWAYIAEVRGMRSGALKERGVVLATEDGKMVEIPTSSKENALEMMNAIETVAPSARLGYNADRAEQFRKDPASIRIQNQAQRA